MLKCIPPTSVLDPLGRSASAAALETVESPSPPTSAPASVAGLRRKDSGLVDPDLIASATTYLKGYVLGALSRYGLYIVACSSTCFGTF